MVELLPTREGQGSARWHQHWRLTGPQREVFFPVIFGVKGPTQPPLFPRPRQLKWWHWGFQKSSTNVSLKHRLMHRDWWHWNAMEVIGWKFVEVIWWQVVLLGIFFSQKAGAIFCNSQHGCIGKSTAPCQIECLQNSCAKQVRLLPKWLWHVVTFNSMGGPLGKILFSRPLWFVSLAGSAYFKLCRFSQHDTISRSSHLCSHAKPNCQSL